MEARAKVSFVRMTPRKVKIVCDVIRGKDVNTAAAILANLPKAAAEPVAKLLKSAVSNAETNFGMNPDNLYVSEIHADPGPILKRFRASARGRGARVLKRTSHISIVVKDKE